MALAIFAELEAECKPNAASRSALLAASARARRWQESLDMLALMRRNQLLEPWAQSAVMRAMPQGALQLLQLAAPDTALCDAAAVSCRKGRDWRSALTLIDQDLSLLPSTLANLVLSCSDSASPRGTLAPAERLVSQLPRVTFTKLLDEAVLALGVSWQRFSDVPKLSLLRSPQKQTVAAALQSLKDHQPLGISAARWRMDMDEQSEIGAGPAIPVQAVCLALQLTLGTSQMRSFDAPASQFLPVWTSFALAGPTWKSSCQGQLEGRGIATSIRSRANDLAAQEVAPFQQSQ